jgi:hypothetical protein
LNTPECNSTTADTRPVSVSVSVVRVQYDSVRRLWLSPTISLSAR